MVTTLLFVTIASHALGQTAFKGEGIIESTTGGIKFPDGTIQTSAANDDLSARVAELEAMVAELQGLLFAVTRGIDPDTGQDTIVFDDVNVQIVNGTDFTNGAPNGTGNLIIGYNAIRNEGNATEPCPSDLETEIYCNRRIGSHMLVIGDYNNYTSFGGLVVGYRNETAAAYASVSGGYLNTAIVDSFTLHG
jgi:hypothetical protein